MPLPAFDAVFVLDRVPHKQSGGPATYNYCLIEACLRLRLKTLVIVIGPHLPDLLFRVPKFATLDQPVFEFLHATAVRGDIFLTATPSAAARVVKRWFAGSRLNGAARGVATIGRVPKANEVAKSQAIFDRVQSVMVFIDTIFRGDFLPRTGGIKRVLIAHDVFHERVASFEANGMTVVPRIGIDDEARYLSRYDFIFAICDTDASTFQAMVPEVDVITVYPVVSPTAAAVPHFGSGKLLYLGTAAYHNVDGLRWFLEDVWPRALAMNPSLTLEVVGSVGTAMRPAPNVRYHGRVEGIGEIAQRCALAINPVRMGSGIKIKMVDYFNAGLGCVTTTSGAHGFPLSERPFVAFDTAEEFATAVADIGGDPIVCRAMSERALAYSRHFSPAAVEVAIGKVSSFDVHSDRHPASADVPVAVITRGGAFRSTTDAHSDA